MRIGLTTVYVHDQEQARRFYTDVLGLRLKDDVPYGATERWLTVVSPEDPAGPELVLKLADESARAFQQANRERRPAGALVRDGGLPARVPSGSRPGASCSPWLRPGWRTAAPTPSSTTAAATWSISTRPERAGAPAGVTPRLPGPGQKRERGELPRAAARRCGLG